MTIQDVGARFSGFICDIHCITITPTAQMKPLFQMHMVENLSRIDLALGLSKPHRFPGNRPRTADHSSAPPSRRPTASPPYGSTESPGTAEGCCAQGHGTNTKRNLLQGIYNKKRHAHPWNTQKKNAQRLVFSKIVERTSLPAGWWNTWDKAA